MATVESIHGGQPPLTFWQKTKEGIYKVNQVALKFFRNLILAAAFMLFAAVPAIKIATYGIIELSGYKKTAALVTLGITVTMSFLGPKIAPWKDKFVRSASEIIEGIQGLAPKSAAEKATQETARKHKLLSELSTYCRFPDNPLQSPEESLEIVNQLSCVHYIKEKTGGLGVVILSKRDLGSENELPPEMQKEALDYVSIVYPETTSKIYLQVKNLTSFVPILERFKNLNLSLENAKLTQEQINLISKLDLKSLELKNCSLEHLSLKKIEKKIPLFISNQKGESSNLEKLQKDFEQAVNEEITKEITSSAKQEDVEILIQKFVKNLSQDSSKSYYQFARFGVKLDLTSFENLENSKAFIKEFYSHNFVVKELVSPFSLTTNFFESIACMQVQNLKTAGIFVDSDPDFYLLHLSKLRSYLPYLKELHLDFDGEDPRGLRKLLASLPVEKIVLRRIKASISTPYLEIIKVPRQEEALGKEVKDYIYKVKLVKAGLDKERPLADLLNLEDLEKTGTDTDSINIWGIDVSNIVALTERSSFTELFNFCDRQKQLHSLNLAGCGLKADDFIDGMGKPKSFNSKELSKSFFNSLKSLDVSQNPLLKGNLYISNSVEVKNEGSNLEIIKL